MRTYPATHRNPRRVRYGLRVTGSGHIVVHAEQRAIIYRILELRAAVYPLQAICAELQAQHCPPPRGQTWYCTTVKKIIEQNDGLRALLGRYRHANTPSDESCRRLAKVAAPFPHADSPGVAPGQSGLHQARTEQLST